MLFPIDPLEAVDIDYIQDFYYVTDLDENYENASLNVELGVENFNKESISGYQIEIDVWTFVIEN